MDARPPIPRPPRLDLDRPPTNPFTPFLLSHPAPPPPPAAPFSSAITTLSTHTQQLCIKGPLDIPLLLWTIVLCSYLRLVFMQEVFPRVARWWGIKREGKVARFREQGCAVVYFAVVGVWGVVSLLLFFCSTFVFVLVLLFGLRATFLPSSRGPLGSRDSLTLVHPSVRCRS
ncbi:hypothetical protein B0H16DRAFT_202966 [Mycena metata]|uniref:Uncharacterized protein n=1 Tax=Mycena metata TaxID=1033252 RepID=A0AAD7HZQ1_9AGAR|nr:hypothetical protein B0H16DRAFT_202966 [Mycena metata]